MAYFTDTGNGVIADDGTLITVDDNGKPTPIID